ncbi:hypothetical protein I552_3868 [Mycobacterium xenopi 3993]|nr:hypothetical protein I552_3868 [Mycobacterium xenopi 3993]
MQQDWLRPRAAANQACGKRISLLPERLHDWTPVCQGVDGI